MSTSSNAHKPFPDPGSAARPTPENEQIYRLLKQSIEIARQGGSAALDQRGESSRWPEIEIAVGLRIVSLADDDAGRQAWIETIAESLSTRPGGQDYADRFRTQVDLLALWHDRWRYPDSVTTVAPILRETLAWMAAWHLVEAGVPATQVVQAINPTPATASWQRLAADAAPHVKRGLTALMHATRRGTAFALVLLRGMQETSSEVQKRTAAARKGFQASQQRRAAQQEAAFAAIREAQSMDNGPVLHLDGRAMGGSVLLTWIGLVVCSWISLIWGALLSAPFGVGLAMMATFGMGMIVVPIWATFWGFVGMGEATNSTLRQMGFRPVTDGHPIASTTARYAQALDIPMPKIGVIDANNAFAMGVDRHHATVAIGQPLIERLTPAEVNAIIGHELGHVVSGDMRRMMLMRTFQNATVWYALAQGMKQVARWILCWAAELGILAFSRHREFHADAIGAALAGKQAMIGALRKIETAPALTSTERRHARFMFRGKPFSTHPSTAARIAALEQETYLRRLPLRAMP